MAKKLLSCATFLFLFITAASALTVTPNAWNITAQPDTNHQKAFNTEFNDNASVDIEADKNWILFDKTHLESPGNFRATLMGKEAGNYSGKITVQTQNDSVQIPVSYIVETPYEQLFEGWVNTSEQLEIGSQTWKVSQIQSNLHIKRGNTTETIDSEETVINGVVITQLDSIPGKYAKINAKTEQSQTFKISPQPKQEKQEKTQQCKLGIKTITTLSRGSSLTIETVNTKSDNREIVPNVAMTVIDGGRQKNQELFHATSDFSGYAAGFVPEDTKGPVVARLLKPNSSCESSNQRINFGTPYNEFLKENERFHLNIEFNKTEALDKITGEVVNGEGQVVETGVVTIKHPDHSEDSISFNEGTFTFEPDQPGDYQFKASKERYQPSEWKKLSVLKDTDGDKIPDKDDECPEEKGIKENDGCKRVSIDIGFFNGDNKAQNLVTGEQYTLKALSGNDTEQFDDELVLKAGDKKEEIDFDNGTATWTPTAAMVYNARYNQSERYSSIDEQVEVKKGGMNLWKAGLTVAVIGISLFLLYLYLGKNDGGSGNMGRKSKGGGASTFRPTNNGAPRPRNEPSDQEEIY